ncbi:type 1 fimbrial protein [Lelliottia sp. V106_10]|uniref:fimbrial protein n=1 Tax=Lelliottia wanjuensis TaxID=3050585 RepID=UPI00254EEF83|nr:MULTISPECIES: type 1 fimbrial protein [unclassified Lelliottia]MDK9357758.1 type 1 fimbrial protein [Lelliottia sp. V106_16]MDK9372750.1 type 1 fimbrial protein [Lelliottia sp. V106_10]MDK9599554.1 type 1 fimbrial protein [Lelliottia sp. V106_5]
MKSTHLFSTLAITLCATLLTANVFAANSVSIDIKGKVIASPCTTVNGGEATKAVALGDTIGADTLATAGSGTPLVKFELPLTGCPAGTTNIKATFSGTADGTTTTMWKNTATTPAPNTAIELSNQTGSALISNGSSVTEAVTSGTATFKLQARAYSAAGSATPGDIESVIVATFEYQ